MTASRKPKKALIVFILLCLLGAAGFLAYSIFRVRGVDVSGNDEIPQERIVARSGILLDESMFRLDLNAVEANVRQDPYVDVLSVRRKLPDRIEIEVRERSPVAEVVFGSYMVVIDDMGVVLEIEPRGKSQYVEVTGISLQGYKLAEPIVTKDDFQGTSLIALILALKETGMIESVESVDISNPLSILLKLHNGLTVRLGQPDELLDKLAWVEHVLPRMEELGLFDGVLDVTSASDGWYSPRREEELEEEISQDDPLEDEDAGDDSEAPQDAGQGEDETQQAQDDAETDRTEDDFGPQDGENED